MIVECTGRAHHAEARARGRVQSGNFASAYNVNTPPDQIVTAARGKCCGPCRARDGDRPQSLWFGVDKANKRLPYLNEVVFLTVPNQDAADLKFRARELDAVDNIKPENYRWYADNQKAGSTRSTASDLR